VETTLTIRVPSDLKRQLDALSRRTHRSSSELVRESLRRLIASEQIAAVRKMTMPLAEAQGFVTDEDVFKGVTRKSRETLSARLSRCPDFPASPAHASML
jgi:predicted transcriptional regulator